MTQDLHTPQPQAPTPAQPESLARKAWPYWLLLLILLIIDQAIKIWVKTHMYIGQEHRVFEWFRIYFVENEGMAYGMKLGSKLFLTLFRLLAMSAGTYILYKSIPNRALKGFPWVITLILAGGIGNIIDSVFYGPLFSSSIGAVAQFAPAGGGYAPWFMGHVVDMFYFPLYHTTLPSWLPWMGGEPYTFFSPIFNFADACISVGVIITLLFYGKQAAMAIDGAYNAFRALFVRRKEHRNPSDHH